MSGCWGGEVNGKREEGRCMCGWGMVHEGGGFLSSRYHGKKDLRNRRIFLCNFISFRYVRPCPMGLFYFGVFILY